MFLILIGDIDKNMVNGFLSSFADDMKVGKAVESEEDDQKLQQDLHSVYAWTVQNNMELNGEKFDLMHYSHYGLNSTHQNLLVFIKLQSLHGVPRGTFKYYVTLLSWNAEI